MKKWSEYEVEYLKKYYLEKTDPELGLILSRTEEAISNKRRKIGLLIPPKLAATRNPSSQAGEMNGNWKNGISKNSYNYKKIQVGRYPERIKARMAAFNAIKRGKVQRLPCEICGEIKAEAHHDDYSKPLEVRFLCRKHHREAHGGRH